MDFRQLEIFVAVAEDLHFSRAAARIGIAQPPLSQHVRKLEAELGVQLLVRTSRRVAITPAGGQLLKLARELLLKREDAIRLVRRTAEGEVGELAIGFGASSATRVLSDAVRAFRSAAPAVRLSLREGAATELGEALAKGELDVAILRGPYSHRELAVETLAREHLVLVLPASSEHASQTDVALASLATEPFVLFPRHTAPGLYDTIIDACMRSGFSPNIVQEAYSWPTVVSLVAGGMGITVAPASATEQRPQGVVFKELKAEHGQAELVIAYPVRGRSRAAERFVAAAHKRVRGGV